MSKESDPAEIKESEPKTNGEQEITRNRTKKGEATGKRNEEEQRRVEEGDSDAPRGGNGLEMRGNEGARLAADTAEAFRDEKREQQRNGQDEIGGAEEKHMESEKQSGDETEEEWAAKRVPESEVQADMEARSSLLAQGPTGGNGARFDDDTTEDSARPASVGGGSAAVITSSVAVATADSETASTITSGTSSTGAATASAATATSAATAGGNLTDTIGVDGTSDVASPPEILRPGSGEPTVGVLGGGSSGDAGSAGVARSGGGVLRSEEGRRVRRRVQRQSWSGACMFWSIAALIVIIAALGAYLTADGQLPNDTVRYVLVATTVVFAVASLALLLAIRYVDPGIVPPSAVPDPVVVRAEMGDVSPELLRDSSGQDQGRAIALSVGAAWSGWTTIATPWERALRAATTASSSPSSSPPPSYCLALPINPTWLLPLTPPFPLTLAATAVIVSICLQLASVDWSRGLEGQPWRMYVLLVLLPLSFYGACLVVFALLHCAILVCDVTTKEYIRYQQGKATPSVTHQRTWEGLKENLHDVFCAEVKARPRVP
ncbi:unnamed protein product [Closterium sp. NIES-64]|nr:unnamed protein product [Closterium sp. NIES-64]